MGFAISHAQYTTVSGTVYDITAQRPLEAVAVLSTSGNGTITDSLGRYSIKVKSTDSIWFSLIGKTTFKYAVDTIANTLNFDIMIHVSAAKLPSVTVRNKNYRLDSIQNRKDYAKYFSFKKPSLQLTPAPAGYNTTPGATVGIDLIEFINMFRFKRTRQLLALQRRLKQQEKDKYIDYRFKKILVIKLTGLASPALDSFMEKYRPDYDLLTTLNDLEFGYYIQQCYEAYKMGLPNPYRFFKKETSDEEE
ncbi:MAG: hypothetical protein KF781_09700 [Chitinophagaceae bacterium]|nr:hypothetical protein [Chitinophagaceae bacterium]MCW5905517.1 hypothetical protein [Chitinophagaceae bacterium]